MNWLEFTTFKCIFNLGLLEEYFGGTLLNILESFEEYSFSKYFYFEMK